MTPPPPRPRRTTVGSVTTTLLVLVVLVLSSVAAAWATDASGDALDGAPVALVGPAPVVVPVARRAEAGTDGRLVVAPRSGRRAALADLEAGRVVAVLELDLAGTQDTLVVPASAGERLRAALVAQVGAVVESYGRTVRVEEAVGPAAGLGVGEPAVAALVAVMLGLVLVSAVSVWRGPHAATRRRGLARVAAVLATAATTGIAVGALASSPALGVVLALATCAAGLTTLAAESLFGLLGIALAAALLVVAAIPVLRAGDVLLLPGSVQPVAEATVVGAVVDALRAPADPRLTGWPVTVLEIWSLLALATLAVSRRVVEESVAHEPTTSRGRLPVPRRWRVSILGVVVVVAVAAGAARATATDGPVLPSRPASVASESTCVATGTVAGVRGLNQVTRLRLTPDFRGGDVGVEARLQDDRLFWLFGDTLREGGDGADFVRNSVLVVEPGCLRVVRAAGGGAALPDRSDGVGYWPMSLTVDRRAGYDLVTVFAQRVRTTGAGVFAFEALGPAAAEFFVPVGEPPQLVAVHDLGPDRADVASPMWGAASLVHRGWLYAYGTARPSDGSSFGFALLLARVRPDEVAREGSWRYWDGTGWSPDPDRATELVGAVGGVSQTLSVFRRGDTWYAFSKRDEFLGRDLVFWTAPAPTGPFTAQPPVGGLPSDLVAGQLRYMPLAHPDLLPKPGSVVVSYSRNRTEPGEVVADPLTYRPRFLRLPLPRG